MWMYTTCNISPKDQLNWFANLNKDDKNFVILYNEKRVGFLSVTNIDMKNRKCTWAYYLFPEYFGKALAPGIEYLALEYIFSLGIERLECTVFSANHIIKLHEKFGFRPEAYYRDFIIKDGVPIDVIGMSILKKEWDLLKNSLSKYNKNEFSHNSGKDTV